jgi:hypothetical protein
MTVHDRLYGVERTGKRLFRRLPVLPALVTAAGGWVLAPLVVRYPVFSVLGSFVGLSVIVAATLPRFVERLFLVLFGLLLLGYAFFGRAFAHVGIPPVFVGETVLAVGLLTMLTTPGWRAAFESPVAWLYLAFAAWGAARAIPFLPIYGVDVLRDSVTWGYGVFALLIPAIVVRPQRISTLLTCYARWMPLLLLWMPIGLLFDHAFTHLLPLAPGSEEPMSLVKPGEGGVHLAGAATFLLLGLHRAPGVRARTGLLGSEWFLGAACVLAFLVVGVFGRGGALAAIVGVFAVLAIRPVQAMPKMLLVGGGMLVAALVLLASNVTIELGRRDFSAHQLGSNLMSIVGDDPEGPQELNYTREWRLRWWNHILDYTIHGPYFWTGKGFGINLAIDDGVKQEAALRSPHSGHMSVLARMGVPGLVLWVLLQSCFGLSMVAGYVRARHMAREWWARLTLWILAYWLASLTEISFAVYLEGPPGGIWFWSLMGFGIAVLIAQRQLDPVPYLAVPTTGFRHEAAARP